MLVGKTPLPPFEKKGGFEIGDNFIKKIPAVKNTAGVNI